MRLDMDKKISSCYRGEKQTNGSPMFSDKCHPGTLLLLNIR